MTGPGLYDYRPRRVQAVQWDGTPTAATTVIDWLLTADRTARYRDDLAAVTVDLPGGGVVYCTPGDWLILDGSQRLSMLTAEQFTAEYEPAPEGN
jgi:hypothetical protein